MGAALAGERRVREQVVPVVRVVQAAQAGAVRAALVLCGGRCGAGEAGAPDEVPAAGEGDARSVQSPGLSLPKSHILATSRRLAGGGESGRGNLVEVGADRGGLAGDLAAD